MQGSSAGTGLRTRCARSAAIARSSAVLVAVSICALGTATAATARSAELAGATRGILKSSPKPISGGTFTYAIDGAQLTLNPAVSQSAVTGLIDRNIFDSLVVQTGPTTFGPWLASSWSISKNGENYTFHLKPGVKFQDGTPLTAQAVKTDLDYVVNPTTKSAYAAALIKPYASASVVNRLTVRIHLTSAFSPLLQALSTPYLGIQSPKELALPATNYVPVGTGPFKFVSWPQNQNVELVRNPHYTSPPSNAPHVGDAYLSNLDFDIVQEDSTRFGALTSGQATGIGDVPAVDVGNLKHNSAFTVQADNVPGLNYMLFLNGASGPLSNVLVRRALAASIVTKPLVRSVYFGRFLTATGVLSPTTGDYSAAAAKSAYSSDPAEAVKLLEQAGYTQIDSNGYREKNGQELTIVWPYPAALNKQNRDVLADGIVADAKAVGINIERPTVDLGTLVTDLSGTSGWDIADAAFARPSPDGLRFAFASNQTYAEGGANVVGLHSATVDTWIAQATATTNPVLAATDYSKVQAYVLANAYVIPLYTPNLISGYSDKVQGIGYDAQANPIFYDAWLSH
jgi:peptide/nickel transport system substrate-binding protein